MNGLVNYLRKHNTIFLFLGILIIWGVISGVVIGFKYHETMKVTLEVFKDNISGLSWSNLLSHFGLFTFLLITSFFIVGILFYLMVLFLEGLNIGFLLTIFLLKFHIKGFLFAILLFIIKHGIALFGLIFLFFKCLELARSNIGKIIYKKNNDQHLMKYLKNAFYLIIICLVGDILMLFLGSKILHVFDFLLK